MKEYKEPAKILDGPDMNYDLRQLVGYVWAEGNQKREFPSTHMCELITHFLDKHRAESTDMNNSEENEVNNDFIGCDHDARSVSVSSAGYGVKYACLSHCAHFAQDDASCRATGRRYRLG